MKKTTLLILIFLTLGCSKNTVTIGTGDVFITEDANSDNVVSEGNSLGFVLGKEKGNIALLEISSKAMTPSVLIMPFNASGVEQLQNMLIEVVEEKGTSVPFDIIKNNRDDYLACVLLRSNNNQDEYVMCEMNGTAVKDGTKRRSIFFTIDFPQFYMVVSSALNYMTGGGGI